jgi:hypothetical protein
LTFVVSSAGISKSIQLYMPGLDLSTVHVSVLIVIFVDVPLDLVNRIESHGAY